MTTLQTGLREQAEAVVSDAFVAKADEAISHYPVSKRSAVLPLLHLWQEEFGFVGQKAIGWIAARLALQPIHVLEVITFYPMFRQRPFGKIHIKVCRTLSCALAGAYNLFDEFKKATGAQDDPASHGHVAHSPDGQFSVEFVECLAACGTAPVCMINDDLHERVTPENVAACLATGH